jgi:hypothetical protein
MRWSALSLADAYGHVFDSENLDLSVPAAGAYTVGATSMCRIVVLSLIDASSSSSSFTSALVSDGPSTAPAGSVMVISSPSATVASCRAVRTSWEYTVYFLLSRRVLEMSSPVPSLTCSPRHQCKL